LSEVFKIILSKNGTTAEKVLDLDVVYENVYLKNYDFLKNQVQELEMNF
jgi:hypothetical protein